jgi:predicted ATPase
VPHLTAVEFREPPGPRSSAFPFTVTAIQTLLGQSLAFPTPVNLLVGENGSGKSTLLEGLACAVRLPAIGSADPDGDPFLEHGHALAQAMRLRWSLRHPHRGFFLRAEDFFGFSKRIDQMRTELQRELKAVQDDPNLSDLAKGFGSMPFASQIHELRRLYGEGFEVRSHGEQFLDLFSVRCIPGGLYLLDEPEAPLSPARQLSLISLIMRMASEEDSQFIIATHSPMLMSIPGATIYSFDSGAVQLVDYHSLDHVIIMRTFLDDPNSYLRHL